jgi:hypothetical protein
VKRSRGRAKSSSARRARPKRSNRSRKSTERKPRRERRRRAKSNPERAVRRPAAAEKRAEPVAAGPLRPLAGFPADFREQDDEIERETLSPAEEVSDGARRLHDGSRGGIES